MSRIRSRVLSKRTKKNIECGPRQQPGLGRVLTSDGRKVNETIGLASRTLVDHHWQARWRGWPTSLSIAANVICNQLPELGPAMIGDRASESPLTNGLSADVQRLGHRRDTEIVNDAEIRIGAHPSDLLGALRALVTAYRSSAVAIGLSMTMRRDSRREKRGNVRYPDEEGAGSRFGIVIGSGLRPGREHFAPETP